MNAPAAPRPDEGALPSQVSADTLVLPGAITAGQAEHGPRFGDDVWDVRGFVPRTTRLTRVDFTTLADPAQVRTAKEYLFSRLRRGIPANRRSATARPMKLTGLVGEFAEVRTILAELARVGAPRLAEVTHEQLGEVLAGWKRCPDAAAGLVGVIYHLAAHGAFLTDALAIAPWPGRSANQVAARRVPRENATPRIPEQISAALVSAAVFYVETASRDLLAARAEIEAAEAVRAGRRLHPGSAREALTVFIEQRRRAGRGLPGMPLDATRHYRGVPLTDGVVQAPNESLIGLLAGVHGTWYHPALLEAAGAELGYEQGGLDTVMSTWPATGAPWRAGLDAWSLSVEISHLRTACWIVIAYLSGMRDSEVRELHRDCATTEVGADGRVRHKLRGRVFKERCLAGEEADWVVLGVVHHAVEVLRAVGDDPTHLFGHSGRRRDGLITCMPARLNSFAAHANELFSTAEEAFLPGYREGDEVAPWRFTTRQFRRTLAWHIAHQPFGVVAGARQYKHAQIAVFEGYAGTSASGFAAEVAAEVAIARLDYVEELYRDFLAGGPSGGGAARGIDAEFARIRAELADLPGTIADQARLRAMLDHLAATLHPGVLGDCFYRAETALCATRAAPVARPLPMLDACLSCPNARRSAVHLPRLAQAREQARQIVTEASVRATPPHQQEALAAHLRALDRLIDQAGGSAGQQGPPG